MAITVSYNISGVDFRQCVSSCPRSLLSFLLIIITLVFRGVQLVMQDRYKSGGGEDEEGKRGIDG